MSPTRRGLLAAVGSAATAVAGCTDLRDSAPQRDPPPKTDTPTLPPADATYAYTHLQPSGNRTLSGPGVIDDVQPVTIDTESEPMWLLASGDEASYWTIVTVDGTASTHQVRDGDSETVATHGRVWLPPLAYRTDGRVEFVDIPEECARHSHPVVAGDQLVYVADDGTLVVHREDDSSRLDVNAPPDARLVAIDEERYALYGAQTTRYGHGALGDTTEGGSLVVADVSAGRIDAEVTLDPPLVFEGLSPLVADIDGDGESELVTTVADSSGGARIRLYDTDGTELATGPVYGSGWRHQLCVAPFGPGDVPELGVVRKPHVDRTVEFYRFAGGELTVTASIQGYSSHTYASRNLDGGLAADLDDDGQMELLVPTTDRRTLTALRRTDDGATVAWSLLPGGELTTNITGVALAGNRIAIGAGTADGVRIWQG